MSELMIELRNETAQVLIEPSRGGIVTAFHVGGEPVLYLDEATLRDPQKNVRGGIPVLFPTPGKLTADHWRYGGREGSLPQHGFARTLPWTQGPSERGARLALVWPGDPRWPWPCTLTIDYALVGRTLRLDQHVTNDGDAPMPFGLGLHPYFHVPDADKARTRIPTAATRAYDNVAKRALALDERGIDLTAPEVDLHLFDHGSREALLMQPGRTVRVRASAEYRTWVVWTLRGKDYVCVEPWTCPGDALNRGVDLLTVEPGETRSTFVEIAVV